MLHTSLTIYYLLLSMIKPHLSCFFNNPPKLQHLRVFGYLCFACNVDPYQSKFYSRAIKCVFLGFSSNVEGYRVYDIISHKIFLTRIFNVLNMFFPLPLPLMTFQKTLFIPLLVLLQHGLLTTHIGPRASKMIQTRFTLTN